MLIFFFAVDTQLNSRKYWYLLITVHLLIYLLFILREILKFITVFFLTINYWQKLFNNTVLFSLYITLLLLFFQLVVISVTFFSLHKMLTLYSLKKNAAASFFLFWIISFLVLSPHPKHINTRHECTICRIKYK